METFIRILVRYHFLLLFLIIETISLTIVIRNDDDKFDKFISSSNAVSGFFYDRYSSLTEYLTLKDENQRLNEENTLLRNTLEHNLKVDTAHVRFISDTLFNQQFTYYPAKVINNTINRPFNYITLNKGKQDGIEKDMAVISPSGIVGIVRDVSKHYSSVISVINKKLGISAKLKKNEYFGSVVWDGRDYSKVTLKEIPYHVIVSKGDTVITSGYSAIFPEGILIGTISDFTETRDGNFWNITVKLSTDLKKINNVYIIGNFFKEEQKKLETSTPKDD